MFWNVLVYSHHWELCSAHLLLRPWLLPSCWAPPLMKEAFSIFLEPPPLQASSNFQIPAIWLHITIQPHHCSHLLFQTLCRLCLGQQKSPYESNSFLGQIRVSLKDPNYISIYLKHRFPGPQPSATESNCWWVWPGKLLPHDSGTQWGWRTTGLSSRDSTCGDSWNLNNMGVRSATLPL